MPKIHYFFLLVILMLLPVNAYAAEEGDIILAEVNRFRQENGLPPVKSDPQTCEFASLRAREASEKFSHDGFYQRVKNKTMPYPAYKRVTENLAKTKRQNAVKLWTKSPTHAANMLKKTSRVCVQKYGHYYAYEGVEI